MARILLTSQGLNSKVGYNLIKRAIHHEITISDRVLLVSMENVSVNELLVKRLEMLGFGNKNISVFNGTSNILESEKKTFDYIVVGEGNIFRMLKGLREFNIDLVIKKNVTYGATYIGSSAGAALCGIDIKCMLDFDENEEGLSSFDSFGFYDGMIIPHYNKVEMNRYCKNTPKDELARYKNIINVPQCRLIELKYGCN